MISRMLACLAILGSLGACADQAALGPPRSTGVPFEVNNRPLQPANSLPPGFTTVDPIAPAQGNLGTFRTSP